MTPFSHPILGGLLGDDEVMAQLSAEADIRAMLRFEAALARAEAEAGLIDASAARRIAEVAETFVPDAAQLREATVRDGVPVSELVRQLRAEVGGSAASAVHLGATSQDVIDTSLMLRMQAVAGVLATRIGAVDAALNRLEEAMGARTLTGHTRMQAAIPITVADRIRAWRGPLAPLQARLRDFVFPVQIGGAAGTLDKLGDQAAAVRAALARDLGVADRPQWHTQREVIADLANLLSLITGALGKFGQDIALMAQDGGEVTLSGGGGSSAMPHKQNPVAAEVLVTLARFNAGLLGTIHQSLVHEQERSGAAWMLEWLTLPQMAVAAAASLRGAGRLCTSIERLGRQP